MTKTAAKRPSRTWSELGRDDALAHTYRPPTNSSQARMQYQYGWEEAADDAAWQSRVTAE